MDFVKTDYTIERIVDCWKTRLFATNDEYQRGATWTLSQKQSRIDSVFRAYPIPAIFVHEIVSLGPDGQSIPRFDIVDGQQRIRALDDFTRDKFALLDPQDRKLKLPNSLRKQPAPWSKKRFSELDSSLKKRFNERKIDVFLIKEVNGPDEVRDLFIRLQSGTPLTRQQVRDAWPGSIGPYIEKLAGKKGKYPAYGLFRLADKRGARNDDDRDQFSSDRQLCSQLLCLFLARENDPCVVQSISANALDKLYHENTEFDVTGPAAQRFEAVVDHTTKALKKSVDRTQSKKKVKKLELIASFLLAQDLSKGQYRKIDASFYNQVAEYLSKDKTIAASGKSTSGTSIVEYYEEWRDGVLPGLGIQKDPKRAFDESQRSEIYSRQQGKCAVCGHEVADDEAEYDHYPVQWEMGGRTLLENGRLVHEDCHPRGRPVEDDD